MPVTRGDGLEAGRALARLVDVRLDRGKLPEAQVAHALLIVHPLQLTLVQALLHGVLIATKVRVQHHSPRKRLCLVLRGVPLIQVVPLGELIAVAVDPEAAVSLLGEELVDDGRLEAPPPLRRRLRFMLVHVQHTWRKLASLHHLLELHSLLLVPHNHGLTILRLFLLLLPQVLHHVAQRRLLANATLLSGLHSLHHLHGALRGHFSPRGRTTDG